MSHPLRRLVPAATCAGDLERSMGERMTDTDTIADTLNAKVASALREVADMLHDPWADAGDDSVADIDALLRVASMIDARV